MKTIYTILSLFIFISFYPLSSLADVPDLPKITAENFDSEYQKVSSMYEDIINNTSKTLLKKIKRTKGKTHYRLTAKQNQLRRDYKKLFKQKIFLDPIENLRVDLNNLYLEHYEDEKLDRVTLNDEATHIAINLIDETEVLKKKYKSIFIPIIHNMMIDVGVRKRGACKHWAEDLLEHTIPIKRKYFNVTWGEANSGKFTEHNVIVIIPKGRPFEDGLLYDPWRTSGTPFWVKVTGDKHYKWTRWTDYGFL